MAANVLRLRQQALEPLDLLVRLEPENEEHCQQKHGDQPKRARQGAADQNTFGFALHAPAIRVITRAVGNVAELAVWPRRPLYARLS